MLSDEKIGDYYITVHHVLANIFSRREITVYNICDKRVCNKESIFQRIWKNLCVTGKIFIKLN